MRGNIHRTPHSKHRRHTKNKMLFLLLNQDYCFPLNKRYSITLSRYLPDYITFLYGDFYAYCLVEEIYLRSIQRLDYYNLTGEDFMERPDFPMTAEYHVNPTIDNSHRYFFNVTRKKEFVKVDHAISNLHILDIYALRDKYQQDLKKFYRQTFKEVYND